MVSVHREFLTGTSSEDNVDEGIVPSRTHALHDVVSTPASFGDPPASMADQRLAETLATPEQPDLGRCLGAAEDLGDTADRQVRHVVQAHGRPLVKW